MSGNLVKAGHKVAAFDIVSANVDAAAQAGVDGAQSAAAAADGADVVVTMLPAGKHVLEVYDSILSTAKSGTLFIDSSTIDVTDARKAHEMASAAGMLSLDAPVSGGVGAAEPRNTDVHGRWYGCLVRCSSAHPRSNGQEDRALRRCWCRSVGENLQQHDSGGDHDRCCRGLRLGEKLGLTHQALFDVVSTATGSCWAINNYCPVPGPVPTSPANNDFKPGFATALMAKDLTLAQNAALSAGATTPMGAEAAHLYRLYMSTGSGDTDFSSIIRSFVARRIRPETIVGPVRGRQTMASKNHPEVIIVGAGRSA